MKKQKFLTVMNPWPGLASYNGEDGRILYGRSHETNEVYSLIRNNLFITLYGRSGIGKTSLIKAGVSPYLKRSGYMPVYVRLAQEIRKEGETTFAGCLIRFIRETAATISAILSESSSSIDYSSPDALWQWFVSSDLTSKEGTRIIPIIFLDQFEEVFSVNNEDTILLLRQLCTLVDGRRRLPEEVCGMLSKVRVVVSMRDDSLYKIEDVIDTCNLFPLKQKRYTLKPLDRNAAVEVISTPVKGLVGEETVSQILRKVSGMSSAGSADPAVLSLMMSELYKKSDGGPITPDLVAGMDSEIVDSFYREGTGNIPDKEMEFLETHLVTSDGRRSVVAGADLCKNVSQSHIESLLDSHIISRLKRGDFTDYELSHDVLCKRVVQNKLDRERRNAKKRQRRIMTGVIFLLVMLISSALTINELRNRRWTMLKNQSHFVAEKALSLCNDGDNLLAQRLLCEVMPKNLKKEERLYVAAAEGALRKALMSNGGILRGHTDDVNTATFSLDGKQIVSVSDDKTVRVWDAGSGECLKTFRWYSNLINSATFSPDGRRLVSESFDNVRIWDTESGECLKTIEGHFYIGTFATFSPDGRRLVSESDDNTVCIWDTESGECLKTLEGHSDWVKSAAFSPDGRYIVSASSDKTVRIWYTESGECLKTLDEHSSRVNSAAFSPDGRRIVSASSDHTVRIWDTESGECLKTLEGHSGVVISAAFSPDGRCIVSASSDHTVRIWDTESGECLKTLEGHSDWVKSAAFSPDGGYIVSASDDHTVRIWDMESDECLKTFERHSDIENSAAFSPDGRRIVSASDDHTVRIWDTESGECLKTLEGHSNCVESAAFSPDGRRIVSASSDHTVRIWDTESSECLKTMEGHFGSVNSAAFSPDGRRIVSASSDKTVRIWDTESGECLKTLEGHSGVVISAAFSPDGRCIVSGSFDKTVRIWDTESGECLKILEGHSFFVLSAAFSPDGRYIVSASSDKTVRIWYTESGECLKTLEGHSYFVFSATFSPDGRRIVSASSDGIIRIWDFPPLQELLDRTREKFKNNPLTPEERERYYLQ